MSKVTPSGPLRPFLHHMPQIDPTTYVDPTALLIGQVKVGADSSIWPMVVARGDVNTITIGRCSNVQDGSVLHVTHDHAAAPGGHPLLIGDEVTVGHNATLHGCVVGDRCLIGMGAIVLDGAVIESEVLLAAGSLVTPGQRLTSGWLWLGRPARQVRQLTPVERERFAYSASQYTQLADAYR